jgi:hypothetical protein
MQVKRGGEGPPWVHDSWTPEQEEKRRNERQEREKLIEQERERTQQAVKEARSYGRDPTYIELSKTMPVLRQPHMLIGGTRKPLDKCTLAELKQKARDIIAKHAAKGKKCEYLKGFSSMSKEELKAALRRKK